MQLLNNYFCLLNPRDFLQFLNKTQLTRRN